MMSMSSRNEKQYIELRHLVEQMAGQRLPGERELAVRLNLSRPQVRALLDRLEDEGLIQRLQGSGTYAVDTRPGQLGTVALLIDESLKLGEDPFFSLLVERLQFYLQEAEIHCTIERIGPLRTLRARYDGAITLGQAGERVLKDVPPGAPPIVGLLLDTLVPVSVRASIFQLADREAGREATRYLINAGYRDLIFVGRRDIAASCERLMGVEEAVAAQDTDAQSVNLRFVSCSLNYSAGVKAGRELVLSDSASASPPAIIAANDWLAVGLRAGLDSVWRGRSGSVGDTSLLRIISFDGLPIAADPVLDITSLAVPVDALASDAVAELHRLLSSPVTVGRLVRYPLAWL
jgi:DNA-binding LacI/PurR family transcriptional regulator